MWQHLWEKLVLDPWWFAGSAIIFLLLLTLFLVSFLRNFRTLWWFYGAGILCALLFLFLSASFLPMTEHLASYRSDWSLSYLVQTFSFQGLLSEVVFYLGLYGFSGAMLLVLLGFWSLISLQWKRLKVLWNRALEQSWFVILFALLNVFFHHAGFLLGDMKDLLSFEVLFHMLLFLFLFQLFLRLVDSARLHTSQVFIEFGYAVGFLFLLARSGLDWNALLSQDIGTLHELFLSHVFVFFLGLLLLGFFLSFGVKAFFVSPFYLDQYLHRSGWGSSFLKWFSDRKKMYSQLQIFAGILLCSMIGFLFFFLKENGMYLLLVFTFFFGYFALFFVLDRQEDLRIRGDLVQKRIHSGHQKSFMI